MTLPQPIKRAGRGALQALMRAAVARAGTRALVNRWYLGLGWEGRVRFRRRFARIFREDGRRIAPGPWHAAFAGRRLVVPLGAGTAGLDWDLAVSVCANDPEIKRFYERMLAGERPDLFVDIGANFGMHSLLFLIHGVPCLPFEPNPRCRERFAGFCAANGVEARAEPVALGAEEGEVRLHFPPDALWCGSVVAGRVGADRTGLAHEDVPLRRLDGYRERLGTGRVLVKIDAEGSELAILSGARETLARLRPTVVLESHRGDGTRGALFDLLGAAGYALHRLEADGRPGPALARAAFDAAPGHNFVARPAA